MHGYYNSHIEGEVKRMDFKTELERMEARMFTPEVVSAILMEHQEKVKAQGDYWCGYDRDFCALYALLDHQERNLLAQWTLCFQRELVQALRHGFKRGILAAFQQHYNGERAEEKLEALIQEAPELESDRLRKVLENGDAVRQSYLGSLQFLWLDRRREVLRHGFYLGYQYALGIVA